VLGVRSIVENGKKINDKKDRQKSQRKTRAASSNGTGLRLTGRGKIHMGDRKKNGATQKGLTCARRKSDKGSM